jgi:hypothetical protein
MPGCSALHYASGLSDAFERDATTPGRGGVRSTAIEDMTMKNFLAGLVLIVLSVAAPAALGQGSAGDGTDLQALRQVVKNDKHAFVESVMDLTPAEAKRFWPIYGDYQQMLEATLRRRVVALQGFMFRDKPVTNLAAKHYATEMLAIDEAEITARRSMRNRVMRALPAVKAARYMQLEEKIRAVQDYDAAAAVPLAR